MAVAQHYATAAARAGRRPATMWSADSKPLPKEHDMETERQLEGRMLNLRVGIAGFGLAGSVFHAPLVSAVDGLEIDAILTRSPERAAQADRKSVV